MTGYLIDMDGVIYRGGELIPGSDLFIKKLIEKEIPFRFMTNNSQRTRLDVVAKFMKKTNMNAVREVDLSRSKRGLGEDMSGLDAFADALDAQPGTVSVDLTKTRWIYGFRLKQLFERAGDTIDALVLSQAKQDGNTLGALEKARGGALRTLDLSRNRIWNRQGLDVLLRSKILPQLHTLDLSRNELNGRTLGPLVTAVAPTVRHLGLMEVREPSFLRDRLAEHPLPRLTRLALDTEGFSSRLDPEGVRALTLASSGCGACDLPKHPIFGRLTALTLWRADNPEFVADLLARADLSDLRVLTLEDIPAHGSVLEALVNNPTTHHIERLHILNSGFNEASGQGLERLLELPSLSELRITRLSDYDAKHTEELVSSPRLSRLGELALLDCVLPDAIIERLFHNPALERLELLRMRPVGKLSKDTVELLVDPPYTPRHWRPSTHILERRESKRRLEAAQAKAEEG